MRFELKLPCFRGGFPPRQRPEESSSGLGLRGPSTDWRGNMAERACARLSSAPSASSLPAAEGSPALQPQQAHELGRASELEMDALDLHSPRSSLSRAPTNTILRRRSTESSLLTRLRRGSSALDLIPGSGGGGGGGGGGGSGGDGPGSGPPSRRTSRGVSFSDEVAGGVLPLVRRGSTHSVAEYDRAPPPPSLQARPAELDLPPLGTAFLRTPSLLEAIPGARRCCVARRWRQVFYIFDEHMIKFFGDPRHFLERRPPLDMLPLSGTAEAYDMYIGQVQHEEGQGKRFKDTGGRVYTITFTLKSGGGGSGSASAQRRDLKLGLRRHQAALDLLAHVQSARYGDVDYKAIDAATFEKLEEAHFISSVFTTKLGTTPERLPNQVQKVQLREAAIFAKNSAHAAALAKALEAEATEAAAASHDESIVRSTPEAISIIEEAEDEVEA